MILEITYKPSNLDLLIGSYFGIIGYLQLACKRTTGCYHHCHYNLLFIILEPHSLNDSGGLSSLIQTFNHINTLVSLAEGCGSISGAHSGRSQ